jgi:hypothetical protein
MYIWGNTATGNPNPSGTPYEGAGYTEFTTSGSSWWGLGFVSTAPVDFSMFTYAKYTLHFAIKTTSSMPIFVKLEGANGTTGVVYLSGKNAFARDGQWHVIEIPMADFFAQGLVWNGPVTANNYFTLVSEGNIAGSVVGFDDVWFFKEQSTGIDYVKTNANQLSVYQNAGTVYVSGLDVNTPIEIISLTGAIVKKTTATEIYVGDLAKGLYIVKAGSKTAKIIIK